MEKATDIYAVVDGEFLDITSVQDEVFASKMMGDGFAITPTSPIVSTPVAGEVVSVFPTKHAYGIKTPSGVEVIVHIGTDTVELEGAPFTAHVQVGDNVTRGAKLATVDFDAVKAAGKGIDVIVVFTNKDAIETLNITETGLLSRDEIIGAVTVK
jgi:glucose-specific phosphotransferase system IIA component